MKKKTGTPPDTELRRQAEAKLSGPKKKPAARQTSDMDTLRLIHELEVHQIELEMQNEELARSHAELEATLSLYAELYAFAPVGYFTMRRDGTIRRANLTGAKLLGLGLSELIKRRFEVFLEPPSQSTFRAFLTRVFMSENSQTCEVALERAGSTPLWVHVEAVTSFESSESDICYAIVSDITDRKRTELELRHLSTHDALTGLFNRGFFEDELSRLERGRSFPISILMADVDHLKQTNDQEGHAAGDALLKRMAQVLTSAFRAEDMVARVGGDEFAVLLPATDRAAADVLMERVRQGILENNASHPEAPLSFSFGVATAENPGPLAETLKAADANMYAARRGRYAPQKKSRPVKH